MNIFNPSTYTIGAIHNELQNIPIAINQYAQRQDKTCGHECFLKDQNGLLKPRGDGMKKCTSVYIMIEGPTKIDANTFDEVKKAKLVYFYGSDAEYFRNPNSVRQELELSPNSLLGLADINRVEMRNIGLKVLPQNLFNANIHKQLTEIDINGNKDLYAIPPNAFADLKLTSLVLDDNNIKKIGKNAFKGLHELQTLILRNNDDLTKIKEEDFEDLTNLRILDLTRNLKLQDVELSNLRQKTNSLERLTINNENLNCCNYNELSKTFGEMQVEVTNCQFNNEEIWDSEFGEGQPFSDSQNKQIEDTCNSCPEGYYVSGFGQVLPCPYQHKCVYGIKRQLPRLKYKAIQNAVDQHISPEVGIINQITNFVF